MHLRTQVGHLLPPPNGIKFEIIFQVDGSISPINVLFNFNALPLLETQSDCNSAGRIITFVFCLFCHSRYSINGHFLPKSFLCAHQQMGNSQKNIR